jgi:hypothetical protein
MAALKATRRRSLPDTVRRDVLAKKRRSAADLVVVVLGALVLAGCAVRSVVKAPVAAAARDRSPAERIRVMESPDGVFGRRPIVCWLGTSRRR